MQDIVFSIIHIRTILRPIPGAYVFADGRRVEGVWRNDFEEGACRLTTPTGEIRDRIWANGRETPQPCSVTDILPKVHQGMDCDVVAYYCT